MSLDIIVVIAQGSATALIAIGLGVTWIRNGRTQAVKYGKLETEAKNTGIKVDSLTDTVKEIDKKVDKFQTHCADVSGRMDERVNATERDIHELKAKRKRA